MNSDFYLRKFFEDRDITKLNAIDIYKPTSLKIKKIHNCSWISGCHQFYAETGFMHSLSYPNTGIAYKNLMLNNHQFISPSSYNQISYFKSSNINQQNLVLSTTPDCYNYWHWMMDCILKILVLLDTTNIPVQDINLHFCGISKLKQFQIETLEIIGIGISQLYFHERGVRLLESWAVSLPSPISHSTTMIHLLRKYMSTTIDQQTVFSDSFSNKLFVERGNSNNYRDIKNIDELRTIFTNLGFLSINPGSMSINDQINYFSKAKYIVGTHGSAFLNMIYSNSSTVIEFFLSGYCPLHEYSLANNLNHRYITVTASQQRIIDINTINCLLENLKLK